MADKINPDHYKLNNGFEVINLTETLTFNLGNVVKYVARAGKKEGSPLEEDLRKAKWYLDRELSRFGITEN